MSDTNNNSELLKKLGLLKQRNDRDIIYNALKASGSAIPLISPIVGYFYETYIKEPSSQRLHDFLE
ncbi:MAG: hypothetical protein QNJ74_01255 [Trichodesmium sp. MO_231.B1]|nr:hypothetical protein [Trichodesmium sp. MO_231.B1]